MWGDNLHKVRGNEPVLWEHKQFNRCKIKGGKNDGFTVAKCSKKKKEKKDEVITPLAKSCHS